MAWPPVTSPVVARPLVATPAMVTPPVARPPAASPPAASPPVASPLVPAIADPAADLSPSARYRSMVDSLLPISRVTLVENAAFLSFVEGKLTLAVRSLITQTMVRETLRDVELGRFFNDFRQLDVRIDAGAGKTGGERRSAFEDQQQAQAVAAANASPLLKKLVAALNARVESIVPVGGVPQDMSAPELEPEDE